LFVEEGEFGVGRRGSSSLKLSRGIEAAEGPERYVRCIASGCCSSGTSMKELEKSRESDSDELEEGAARATRFAVGENADGL
jgi:hypothetical protein